MNQELEKVQKKYFGAILAGLVLLAIIVTVVAVMVTRGDKDSVDNSGTLEQAVVIPTLRSVAKKGHLNCGLSKRDEDAMFHPEYEAQWEGFNGDFVSLSISLYYILQRGPTNPT